MSSATALHKMQHKLLHESAGQRTFAVVLKTGDEVMACLQNFASTERIFAAQLTAIGALSDLVLMYYDWEKKQYLRLPVRELVEVASLIGESRKRRRAHRRSTSTWWSESATAPPWLAT
jgi:predicted DNA-binding protein with PD1-like motif